MSITNSFLAWKLVDLLSTEFTDWEAFSFGIIDEDGNTLKKPRTADEKDSFGMFHRAVRKIKQIINKFMGASRASAILSTLYLMKESVDDVTINVFLNEIKTLYPDIKKSINRHLVESAYGFNDNILKPGKYYLDFVDGEEKIVITEDTKPIDSFYGFDVYEVEGIVFMKDQIRRVIERS